LHLDPRIANKALTNVPSFQRLFVVEKTPRSLREASSWTMFSRLRSNFSLKNNRWRIALG
jgi:hypothetical protein